MRQPPGVTHFEKSQAARRLAVVRAEQQSQGTLAPRGLMSYGLSLRPGDWYPQAD